MRQLEELCRENATLALDFLVDLLRDNKAQVNARLTAAREILDRGYGKPLDRQQLMTLDVGAIGGQAALSDEQLLRIAAGALGVEVDNPKQISHLRPVQDVDPPPSAL